MLRQARREARLSQRALAERAGVSQSVVARIESGRVDPAIGLLSRLVAVCGCELRAGIAPRATWPHVVDWVGELRRAQQDRAAWERGAVRAEFAAARAAAASVADSWLTVRAKREVSKQARRQERMSQRVAIRAALAAEAALSREGVAMDAGEHVMQVGDALLDLADRVPLEPLRRAHVVVAELFGRPDETAEVDIGLARLRPLYENGALWPFDSRPAAQRPPRAFRVGPDRRLAEHDPPAFRVLQLATSWPGSVVVGAVARWLVDPSAPSTRRLPVLLAVHPDRRAEARAAMARAGLGGRVCLLRDYDRWLAGSSPVRVAGLLGELRLQRPEQVVHGRWAGRSSAALLTLERRDARGRRPPPHKEPPVLVAY